MKDLFTPEIIAVAVVAAMVIVAVFFALVASKMAGIDGKVTELTEDIHKRVEKNIEVLADGLHDEVRERIKEVEDSLSQMGDSWRSTLDKTVSDVRGEVGKLKGEVKQNSESLNESLTKIITDNATDMNEHMAQVRDYNSEAIQSFHANLAQQVREHAKGEQETMNRVLDDISSSLGKNINDLADNQNKVLQDLSTTVGKGFKDVASDVGAKVGKVTEDTGERLADITGKIDSSISSSGDKLEKDLAGIGKRVNDDLESISKNVATGVNDISSDLTKNVTSIADRINLDMAAVTGKLNESVDGVSTNMSERMESLDSKVSANMDQIGTGVNQRLDGIGAGVNTRLEGMSDTIGTKINRISKSVDENLDEMGNSLSKRIHDDMSDILAQFKQFAGRIDAVEQTREQIISLAENVNVLTQVLDDRRARGNIGEILIESIVRDNLTPSDYELDATLSNGRRVDCLLKLPKPSGHVAISTKVDIAELETISSTLASPEDRDQARRRWHGELHEAIASTAEECIIKGETADGAILLLPSESAFSEAHINHRALVDEAYKRQVWLASPSTLIAMVTVARSVIKDATARQELDETRKILAEVETEFKSLESKFKGIVTNVDDLLTSATETRKSARRIGDQLDHANSVINRSQEHRLTERTRDE